MVSPTWRRARSASSSSRPSSSRASRSSKVRRATPWLPGAKTWRARRSSARRPHSCSCRALDEQHTQLQGEQDKLILAEQRLTAKVEAFRTQKETIKAQYTAAEAQAKVGEAVSGISEEMGDIGMAMQRAQDKVATMQARAGAVDELIDSGALQDLSAPGTDSIDRELAQISAKSSVDAELAALKKELGTGTDAPAAAVAPPAADAPARARAAERTVPHDRRPDPGRGAVRVADGPREELEARDARLLDALESNDDTGILGRADGAVGLRAPRRCRTSRSMSSRPSEFVLPNHDMSMAGVRDFLATTPPSIVVRPWRAATVARPADRGRAARRQQSTPERADSQPTPRSAPAGACDTAICAGGDGPSAGRFALTVHDDDEVMPRAALLAAARGMSRGHGDPGRPRRRGVPRRGRPATRIVATLSVGLDHIDLPPRRARGAASPTRPMC